MVRKVEDFVFVQYVMKVSEMTFSNNAEIVDVSDIYKFGDDCNAMIGTYDIENREVFVTSSGGRYLVFLTGCSQHGERELARIAFWSVQARVDCGFAKRSQEAILGMDAHDFGQTITCPDDDLSQNYEVSR